MYVETKLNERINKLALVSHTDPLVEPNFHEWFLSTVENQVYK